MLTPLKVVVGFMSSIGAGALCSEAIKMIRPKDANVFVKACIWAAGIGLSAVVSDAAAKGVENTIDKAENMIKRATEERK